MKFREVFSAPIFEDAEQTRVASLLHASLKVIVITITVLGFIDTLLLPQYLARWAAIVLAIDIFCPLFMVLNHFGRTRSASIGTLVFLWIMITVTSFSAGGIDAPGILGYTVLTVLGGLLMGEKLGVALGILCALSILSLVIFGEHGFFPLSSVRHTPISKWLIQCFFLLFIIRIQFLAVRSIRNLLVKAQSELAARIQSDKALQASEQRYRSLVQATAQIVWTTDAAGERAIEYESWCKFTGQSPESVLRGGWIQAVHPDDQNRVKQAWRRTIANKIPLELEYRVHDANGEWRYVVVRSVPVLKPSGEIREWVGACYDVTERVQAQEANRAADELLEHIASVTANTLGQEYFQTLVRHIAESLHVRYAFVGQYIGQHDRVRTLAVWAGNAESENFEYDLEGTPCQKVMQQSMCIYPENVQRQFPGDQLLKDMDVQSYFGTPVVGRDGEPIGLLVVMHDKPIPSPGERIRSILRIFAARAGMELERIRINEALRASEEKFAKAFQCSPVVICLLSLDDLRFIEVNETFTNVTGFAAEEVIGRSIIDSYLNIDPLRLAQFHERVKTEGKVRNFEHTVRNKWGEIRTGIASAELVQISGRMCLLVSTEDVTEQRNAEKILRESHQELERLVKERTAQLEALNKELEAFSYTVSHDLQAPIRAVTGFARALDEDYRDRLDDNGIEYLTRIRQASARMQKLTEDLLTYARIEHNNIKLVPISLTPLVREIVSDFEFTIQEIGALVTVAELPIVLGDKSLLAQAFTNLIQNAINYRKKDVPLRLTITAKLDNSDACICVTDNGIGIAPKFQQRIFRAFERLQSSSESQGSGLGLANVKRSVESLGGEVWVESELGKGSTFCVKLKQIHHEAEIKSSASAPPERLVH